VERTVAGTARRTQGIPIIVLILITLIIPIVATPSCKQAAPKLSGLCFSPYLGTNPKDAGPVEELLGEIAPRTEGIRTFGSTGKWAKIPPMARHLGLYVAAGAGLYDDSKYNAAQVAGLIKLVKAGDVDLAVVGDENLLWKTLEEDELISYIRQVKAVGVQTTTSDGWEVLLKHPKVMREVDVVVMNVYPFTEGVSLGSAIDYIDAAYRRVKAKAGSKEVIVETGWPSAGESRWNAVPSTKNAARYLSEFTSWAQTRGVRYFYFEAFDESWKSRTEGSVGGHWGLWDKDGHLKPYADTVLNKSP
jgi:exo-beta-1,3-glucanase (GH17 family)